MSLLGGFSGRPRGRTPFGRVALAVPLIASVVLLTVGVVVLARPKKQIEYRLNMLSDLDTNRPRLARRIAAEAGKRGLEVELSQKAYGALEQLEMVNAPNPIDVSLVPGGVGKGQFPEVRQVTALGVEPLHVLVRPELYDEVSKHGLRALEGKRINIGPPTTATHLIARDVLRFAGLTPLAESAGPGSGASSAAVRHYRVEPHTPQELLDQAVQIRDALGDDRARLRAGLPDAALLLAPMPSSVVRGLVNHAGYRLVGIPFTEAYTLDQFEAEKNPDEGGSVSGAGAGANLWRGGRGTDRRGSVSGAGAGANPMKAT